MLYTVTRTTEKLGMEEWIYAVGESLRFSEKGEFDLDLNEEVGPTQ